MTGKCVEIQLTWAYTISFFIFFPQQGSIFTVFVQGIAQGLFT